MKKSLTTVAAIAATATLSSSLFINPASAEQLDAATATAITKTAKDATEGTKTAKDATEGTKTAKDATEGTKTAKDATGADAAKPAKEPAGSSAAQDQPSLMAKIMEKLGADNALATLVQKIAALLQ